MNSRERILAAIDHKEPDRIPIDLGATPSSGISAIAYHNLKKYLEIRKIYGFWMYFCLFIDYFFYHSNFSGEI